MSGVPESICLKLPKWAKRTQIESVLAAVTANTTDSCGDCTAEKLALRCQGERYNKCVVASLFPAVSRWTVRHFQAKSKSFIKSE